MKGLALGLVLALAATAPAGAASPRPLRVMSINLCTDLLVLQVVPKDRIASVTFLAHDAVAQFAPGLDAGVAVNHGAAEEILRQRPDLIVADAYSMAGAKALARKVGAPVLELSSPASFDDVRANARKLGSAVGEPAHAEALVAHMDATLAALSRSRPARPITVAAWSGDSAPGRGSMANAIIEAAGAVNVAARPGVNPASFDLEQLLVARPQVLMFSADADQPSLHAAEADQPLVRRLYAGHTLRYADAVYSCGLPQSADAAASLRRALQAMAAP